MRRERNKSRANRKSHLAKKEQTQKFAYEALERRQVLASLFPTYINGQFTLGNGPGASSPYDLLQTFELESRPSATKTIYIDSTGHHSVNNNWGHDIMFDPFDTDGNPTNFSDDELIELQLQFQNMAEDFLAFDVNVTTKDPGVDALIRNGPNDNEYGIRVVNTQPTPEFGGFCGIAFLNSFGSNIDNPVFTVCNGAMNGALVHSHEVGHALGLRHDGLDGAAYHPGANDWGPIMGAPFGSRITQWSDGNYSGSTNTEDDFQVITTQNGFGFRPDDYGSTLSNPSEMTADENGNVFFWGNIEQNTDVDVFQFTTTAGDVNLTINSFQEAANLNILATLRDADGNLIQTSSPTATLNASFDLNLDAGTYYLTIEGAEDPGVFGDYGSVGMYTVEGVVNIVSGLPVGEVGRLESVTDLWQTVEFIKPYDDPVVVAGPSSYNGRAPLNVRIRNVTSTSFEIHVDEWEYDDGRHRNPEVVDYLVVEAGEYVLEDGSIIVAGNRTNQNHRWTTNSLGDAFQGISEPPVILSQTITDNDPTSVTTRTRRVSTTEFQIKLQEEQANARGTHGNETVSWIAFQQNVGEIGFSSYESNVTPESVTHLSYPMSFQNEYDTPPAFLANMQTYRGGDTATLRTKSLTVDGTTFFVQEERSTDQEMRHNPESVGYVAIEIGEIFGSDNQLRSAPAGIDYYNSVVGNLSSFQGDWPDYSEALAKVRQRDLDIEGYSFHNHNHDLDAFGHDHEFGEHGHTHVDKAANLLNHFVIADRPEGNREINSIKVCDPASMNSLAGATELDKPTEDRVRDSWFELNDSPDGETTVDSLD